MKTPDINIIFGTSMKNCQHQMDVILSRDVEYGGYKRYKKSVELDNGEVFYLRSLPDSIRGIKADRVYVDKRITLDVLFEYILPTLVYANPDYKWGNEVEFYD